MRQQLKRDLKAAMKSRQMDVVTVLRSLLAEIDHAEAVPFDETLEPSIGKTNDVPRKQLTEADVQRIFRREAAQLKAAIAEYEAAGRSNKVQQLRVELDIVEQYIE